VPDLGMLIGQVTGLLLDVRVDGSASFEVLP
jgi:hypothetical protein